MSPLPTTFNVFVPVPRLRVPRPVSCSAVRVTVPDVGQELDVIVDGLEGKRPRAESDLTWTTMGDDVDDADPVMLSQSSSNLIERRLRRRQDHARNATLQIVQNEVDVRYVRFYERQLTGKIHTSPQAAKLPVTRCGQSGEFMLQHGSIKVLSAF
jgi:hypothetical protein